ncbi:accessory Sec system protein Asp2 [Lactococcus lactis]|uniref:accessory Sec system protein Asp2 n=1 Tax=Lactococcus lactis TaxID=1358 RepID=UPI0015D483E7|nr:accessory Sec system protein Asp2 [Lactococcus lactis]GFO78752.1 accessory Sec system protein Asp2 [Lactococcus lactis]
MKNEIIQFGGTKLNFPKEVLDKYNYNILAGNYNFISDVENLEIFIENKFNKKKSRNIYIFGKDATLLFNFPKLLEQFPAYQILFDSNSSLPEIQKNILKSKFGKPVNLDNGKELKKIIEFVMQSSIKQYGYKLDMSYVEIREQFRDKTVKKGNSHFEILGDFGQKMNQIVSWKMHPFGIEGNTTLTFTPEIKVVSGNVVLEFQVFLIDQAANRIIEVIKGSPEEFMNQKKLIINSTDTNKLVSVSLCASGGEGKLEIGQIHFRSYVSEESIMIQNGKRIIDYQRRNEELLYYFHPGDLKPPLSVYFSGYRSAEGFEGRGMISRMGSPFILIADPRLEGGNFYIGSVELEEGIIDIINEKLKWLGFTNRELILSGLSMGTFAALYYSADLEPAAVIVGKPLTNIGLIAENERINRPEIWGTSLDMIMHFGNASNHNVANQLNDKFWTKFKNGKYQNTTFAIAYMKNDDYDGEAFYQIATYLRTLSPQPVLLYKGLIGRHNDNSVEINTWFIKQYRNILWDKFLRRIDYHL